jgi:hypothetical protein
VRAYVFVEPEMILDAVVKKSPSIVFSLDSEPIRRYTNRDHAEIDCDLLNDHRHWTKPLKLTAPNNTPVSDIPSFYVEELAPHEYGIVCELPAPDDFVGTKTEFAEG